MEQDKLAWLRLIRSSKVGPVTFWQLIHRYKTAERALEALSDRIKAGHQNYQLASEKEVHQELKNHEKKNFSLLFASDLHFPQMLRCLPDCPPVISVYGELSILNQPTLGIVGSRNASFHGRKFAEQLSIDLGKMDWKIASGLARGIDQAAHQGALLSGTIAVIAGGVDTIYPPEHKILYHNISKTGAVISEMPLSFFPAAAHFPRRNRLISGLSQGVIVVEAALKSGSLITARTALDQGRELMAVPGSPFDPRSKGTNHLIRQGANLIESAADVLTIIENFPSSSTPETWRADEPVENLNCTTLEKDILQDLSPTPISLEDLVERYAISPQTLLTFIFEWELEGRIQRHPGNQISKT